MGPATFGITLVMFCRLACGKATWHLGALKRIVLRGTAAAFVGTACWFIEQTGALPCPAPISLHPVWHLCAAFAMTHWGCFLKYHRGRFFGYRVAIRGYWWCPFATWAEPDASSPGRLSHHPMVRHSSGMLPSPIHTPRASRTVHEPAIAAAVAAGAGGRRGSVTALARAIVGGAAPNRGRRNSYCEAAFKRPQVFSRKSSAKNIKVVWRGGAVVLAPRREEAPARSRARGCASVPWRTLTRSRRR